jgi:hypothetical protein
VEKVGLLVLILLAAAADSGTYAISQLITKERAADQCAMLALAVPGAAAAGDNEIVDALRGWRARDGRPRRHFPGSG